MKVATVKLTSASPLSQSRKHDSPKLAKELPDAYEKRTWKDKTHTDSQGRILLPGFGLKMAMVDAAKYSGDQIPGKGKSTWTKKFMSGVLVIENPPTNKTADDLIPVVINANSDGQRGSGKRVSRIMPTLLEWQATVTFHIVDDIITRDIFERYLTMAGQFIGIGQYRVQNGGMNGRFEVKILDWKD